MNSRTSTLGWVGFMLVIAFAVPVVGGSLFTAWRARVSAELPPPPPPQAPKVAPPPIELPKRTPPPELPPLQKAMFNYGEVPLPVPERTDVVPRESYRIDLVKEGKGSLATGAKLDIDRDGRFDEIWTFGRPILRDVSPADDGTYTEHYRWERRQWVNASEEPAR